MKLALVVDDSKVQRQILSAFLSSDGYKVVSARDGMQAIDMFVEHQPDLVLMNINMPVMNGFDAARKIQQLSNNNLAPIIFTSSDNSEQTFIDSIEAGGDSVLVSPFSYDVFSAKIKSIERTTGLYRKVKLLQQGQQQDAQIAKSLVTDVVESKNIGIDKITRLKPSADIFNGDIYLCAQSPNGDIQILFGDFTGHGLRSTIGAIPLSETFRVMTAKGFSLYETISQINRQLHGLLPSDLFLAATLVTISSYNKTAHVFNAGLPDAYIFDESAQIKHKVSSCHPPLGILSELLPNAKQAVISINEADRILLISKGILNTKNSEGAIFDYSGFENAVSKGIKENDIAQIVMEEITLFGHKNAQYDDISLIDIPCGGWDHAYLIHNAFNCSDPDITNECTSTQTPIWEMQLILGAERLQTLNPIPMIMNQINAIEGASLQWQGLHIILTELFVNALDHGVLGLNSQLKNAEEGFVVYFNERERKLNTLKTGFVDISLRYYKLAVGGKMIISIKDSGLGFSFSDVNQRQRPNNNAKPAYSGRGLQLVSQLCDSLEFKEQGTHVEAIYLCE